MDEALLAHNGIYHIARYAAGQALDGVADVVGLHDGVA